MFHDDRLSHSPFSFGSIGIPFSAGYLTVYYTRVLRMVLESPAICQIKVYKRVQGFRVHVKSEPLILAYISGAWHPLASSTYKALPRFSFCPLLAGKSSRQQVQAIPCSAQDGSWLLYPDLPRQCCVTAGGQKYEIAYQQGQRRKITLNH